MLTVLSQGMTSPGVVQGRLGGAGGVTGASDG